MLMNVAKNAQLHMENVFKGIKITTVMRLHASA